MTVADHQIRQDHLRRPPQAVEAEQSLLGGLLLNPERFDELDIAAGDFYRLEHRMIFEAMLGLINAGKPVDVVTVFETLRARRQDDDAGGLPYLTQLAQNTPGAANIRAYAKRVSETSRLRRIAATGAAMAEAAMEPGASAERILAEGLTEFDLLSRDGKRAQLVSFAEAQRMHADLMERRLAGEVQAIPTGLIDLDAALDGGLRPGEVFAVGARPSRGKSAFALAILRNVVRAGGAVACFSAEMSNADLMDRIYAAETTLPMSRLRAPTEDDPTLWDRYLATTQRTHDWRAVFDDAGPFNLPTIRSRTRRAKRELGGLDLVIVDYAQLLEAVEARSTRNAEIEAISRGLKTMAKEMGVAVLLLAQLNRAAERNARYSLSDFKDSGSLEQDADVAAFIVNEYLDKSAEDRAGAWKHWHQYVVLQIAKSRQGALADVNLRFRPDRMSFEDWLGEPPERPKIASSRQGFAA